MTSEASLTSPDTDYTRHLQEVLNELRQMEQTPRLVSSPDELEALEREIRQRTDRLGSLLVGYHMQQALDAGVLAPGNAQAYSDLLWALMHGLVSLSISTPLFDTTRLRQALAEAPRLIERGLRRQ